MGSDKKVREEMLTRPTLAAITQEYPARKAGAPGREGVVVEAQGIEPCLSLLRRGKTDRTLRKNYRANE